MQLVSRNIEANDLAHTIDKQCGDGRDREDDPSSLLGRSWKGKCVAGIDVQCAGECDREGEGLVV